MCHFPSSKARHARGKVISRRPEARVACEPRKGETGKRFNDTCACFVKGRTIHLVPLLALTRTFSK